MRTIKFRGKSERTGKFVYGYLFPFKISTHIYDLEGRSLTKVVDVTVGQFTGLQDRKGADIYEGDIILFPEVLENGNQILRKVIFNEEKAGFHHDYISGGCSHPLGYSYGAKLPTPIIVGNIYDNQELLK